MGDRISIRFINDNYKSPVLFSHWQGTSLLEDVDVYLTELREEISLLDHPNSQPLDRLEVGTVMVDFIRWLAGRELGGVPRKRITSNFYLGEDEDDGDNSDNGHVDIDVTDPSNSFLHYCNCGDRNCDLR